MVNTSLRQQLHFFAIEPTDSRLLKDAVEDEEGGEEGERVGGD